MTNRRWGSVAAACAAAIVTAAGAAAIVAAAGGRCTAVAIDGGQAGLGPDSPVTIVAVVLAGDPSREVADALGLLLEQEGMSAIHTSAAAFAPRADADLAQVAADFGAWAGEQGFETEHVLFAEVLASPGHGVAEVRAVLADASGRVVWSERQTGDDRAFRRARPRDPMSCCRLLVERLRPQFGLSAKTRGRVRDGRMARAWAAKSGAPAADEQAAMERRLERLRGAVTGSRVRVFAVRGGEGGEGVGLDAAGAARLARELSGTLNAEPAPAEQALALAGAPGGNERKRLWDLARALREHVRAEGLDADYALAAEYLLRPHDGRVVGVHFVLCDRAGDWVIVDLQNEHQRDFQAVAPRSGEDCAAVVVRRLASYLDG